MTMSEFDARAATWDDDAAKTERAQAVAHAIIGSVPLTGAMHAMEYGCGTGLLTFMLRPRLGQIVLADVSDGMLAVAAGKIAATNDVAMRTVRLDLLVDPLPIGFDRALLGAMVRKAGFASAAFSTAHEIRKKVDGRQRGYPVFLMVARKS